MIQKSKIIAEIGWNHMGSIDLAKEMIDAAKISGSDYCKFQTWKVKNLVDGPWNKDGRIDIYKKAELSDEKHDELINYCKKKEIEFLTSIFNLADLDFLLSKNLKSIKIPSHEVYNLDLIKECVKSFDKIFISVGACKWAEFEKILELNLDLSKVYFMHCVSSYPLDEKNVNFPKLKKIKLIHNQIGYSGHLEGISDAIAAISMGALIVEKHFTTDNNLPGRDNKFAILPEEMKKICEYRDSFYNMNLDRGLDLQDCELDIYNSYRGRWSKK
jgi:N,N'-diacetyllegionaminate synthase